MFVNVIWSRRGEDKSIYLNHASNSVKRFVIIGVTSRVLSGEMFLVPVSIQTYCFAEERAFIPKEYFCVVSSYLVILVVNKLLD